MRRILPTITLVLVLLGCTKEQGAKVEAAGVVALSGVACVLEHPDWTPAALTTTCGIPDATAITKILLARRAGMAKDTPR
jgi:hypothetical protein